MRYEDLPHNDYVDEYAWREAFATAGGATNADNPAERANEPSIGDIVAVVDWYGFSPEGWLSTEMAAVFVLNDGRHALLDGWCDTTGWDCRSDARWYVGSAEAIARTVTEYQRQEFAKNREASA